MFLLLLFLFWLIIVNAFYYIAHLTHTFMYIEYWTLNNDHNYYNY